MSRWVALGVALGWIAVMKYAYWQWQLTDVAFFAMLFLPVAPYALWRVMKRFLKKPKSVAAPRLASQSGSIWKFMSDEEYHLPTSAPACLGASSQAPASVPQQPATNAATIAAAVTAAVAAPVQSAAASAAQQAVSSHGTTRAHRKVTGAGFLDDPLSWLSWLESLMSVAR
jgi:hypothetical protein